MLLRGGPANTVGSSLSRTDGPYQLDSTVYDDYGYPATHIAGMVPAGSGVPSQPDYYHRPGQGYDPSAMCGPVGDYSSQGGYYPQMIEAQLRQQQQQQQSDFYGGCGELTPMGGPHQQGFDSYRGVASLNHCVTNSSHPLGGLGYVDSVGECSPEGSVPSPSPHRGSLNLCSKATADPTNTPVIYPWMKMVHSNQGRSDYWSSNSCSFYLIKTLN